MVGNNYWKRKAGLLEPKEKMRGNMERKMRHSRGNRDRRLGTESVSFLIFMKTSPGCAFAAGDHLYQLPQLTLLGLNLI